MPISSAVTGTCRRRARASICSARSRTRLLFGRPVSASWSARYSSSSLFSSTRLQARWREPASDAIEQEYEGGDEQPEAETKQSPVRRLRSGRRSSPWPSGPTLHRGPRRSRWPARAPRGAGARAADQMRGATGVAVVERECQRSMAGEHGSDQPAPSKVVPTKPVTAARRALTVAIGAPSR